MPMHSDRRRVRGRRSRSELDWFFEDPWADPSAEAFAADEDDWYPELFEGNEARLEDWDPDDEELDLEDPADAWGPIRKRRRRDEDES